MTRALAGVVALACACGRGPVPAREAAPSASTAAAMSDAGPRDAALGPRDIADARMSSATTDASPVADPTPDQDALEEALAALSDEHREGWGPAVAWLVAHPALSRRALRDIVDAAGTSWNPAVDRAALALGEIGAAEDVATLARALARGGETRAFDFAQALAHHQSEESLAALIAATASSHIDVVQAAAMALGTRGGAAARATLEALLDHADQRVRYTAVVALIDLGPAPSRAALTRRRAIEPDREVRAAIRKALAHLTPGR